MPSGKELEQLPMGTIAPGAGKDRSRFERSSISRVSIETEPQPSSIRNEQEERQK